MFESNMINQIVVWEHILDIEESQRRDPFGDFPTGPQPIDRDGYPFASIFRESKSIEEPECQGCPQTSGTQLA
jgi:hypothetical protein